MRFFESVKNILRKGKDFVIDEIELHKLYSELKTDLLNHLTLKDLKKVTQEFSLGVSEKDLYKFYLYDNLHLDDLVVYCQSNNIRGVSKFLKRKSEIDGLYNKSQFKLKDDLNLEIEPKLDVKFNIRKHEENKIKKLSKEKKKK